MLKDSQHGFRSKRSCLTNLLEILDLVSNYVDQSIPVDVIYLDFQKAFEGVVSGWEMVRSGVLFVVFIDNIDENICSTVLKFADDTKEVVRVGMEDREVLRGDLVSLFGWSQDWQMLFNLDLI